MRIAWIAAIVAILLASPCWAQSRDNPKALFKQAVALYDKRDFKTALPMFLKVHDALKSPNALLYAARCLRDTNQLPRAYETFGAVVREANEQLGKDPSYEETRDTAASERSAIEPAVARVVLLAPDPPSGLAITLNGDPVSADRIGGVIAVPPGHVVVDATAPGRRDFHVDVVVREGASAPVTVTLASPDETPGAPAAAPVDSTQPSAAASPDHPQTRGGTLRTIGFVVAGVGVAGFGTSAVGWLMGNSKLSSLDSTCGHGQCQESYFQQQQSQGKTLDAITNVGLVVGIAGVVVGTGMILFGGPHEASARAGLVLSPRGVSVVGAF
jgi:hypothetical protein